MGAILGVGEHQLISAMLVQALKPLLVSMHSIIFICAR